MSSTHHVSCDAQMEQPSKIKSGAQVNVQVHDIPLLSLSSNYNNQQPNQPSFMHMLHCHVITMPLSSSDTIINQPFYHLTLTLTLTLPRSIMCLTVLIITSQSFINTLLHWVVVGSVGVGAFE
jgi:hypothetical protein